MFITNVQNPEFVEKLEASELSSETRQNYWHPTFGGWWPTHTVSKSTVQ